MPQAILRPWPALRRWKPRRQVPALLLLTVALCMVPTVPSYADPPPAASPDFVAIDAYIDRGDARRCASPAWLSASCTTTR